MKFENLMSYLQLSADQLMLWSMPIFFGHLSDQFEDDLGPPEKLEDFDGKLNKIKYQFKELLRNCLC